jgi:mono/diheme cytochrome c family protein
MGILLACEDNKQDEKEMVYWEPQIKALFQMRCMSCHNDPPDFSGLALKTYDQTKMHLSAIKQRVLIQKDMPPGGLRDEVAEALLQTWINQGAQEKSSSLIDGTDQTMIIDIGIKDMNVVDQWQPVTWRNQIEPIFQLYCQGCHNFQPAGGAPYALMDYQSVVEKMPEIRRSVIEVGSMPPGGLSDEDIFNLILNWVDNGYPW